MLAERLYLFTRLERNFLHPLLLICCRFFLLEILPIAASCITLWRRYKYVVLPNRELLFLLVITVE